MKYNFTDDDFYYIKPPKNNKPKKDMSMGDIYKIFVLPIAIAIFLIVIIDFMYPVPSQNTVNQVTNIKNDSYDVKIKKMNISYDKAIKLVKNSSQVYKQNITTINENYQKKVKIRKQLVELVLVDESRFSDDEIAQLIVDYYKIDDKKLILKISKYYDVVIALKENKLNANTVKAKYYNTSLNSYLSLKDFYSSKTSSAFIIKKQKTIKNMKVNLETYYNSLIKYNNLKDYTKMAQTVIDMENVYLKFKDLDSSKSLVLYDMDIKFFVQIGKTSWDKYSDYEYNHIYKSKEVTRKQYEMIQSNISKYASLYEDIYENEYSGMTNREFWINDSYQTYFHKYLNIINHKESLSKWIEVDENYFFKHKEDIQKVIFEKEYGYFTDEATKPLYKYDKDETNITNTSSGGYGGMFLWGNSYYSTHNNYRHTDNKRYNQRKSMRSVSSSNMSRGPNGGGK
jgi:hypothetical protein